MRHAVIADGVVVNVVEAEPGTPGLVPTETAGIGWTWDGLDFFPPVAPRPHKPERRAQLIARVGHRRWEVESGGISFNGALVRTDEVGQTKIVGAALYATLNEDLEEIDWEPQPGEWITIPRQAAIDLGLALGAHVQACFRRSRQLQEAVNAASTHEDIDAVAIEVEAFWP